MTTSISRIRESILGGVKTGGAAFGAVAVVAYIYCSVVISSFKVLMVLQGDPAAVPSLTWIFRPEFSTFYMAVWVTTCALLSISPILFSNQTMFEKMMRDRDETRLRSPILRRLKPLFSYGEKYLPFILALRETRVGSVSYVVTVIVVSAAIFCSLRFFGSPSLHLLHP